MYLHSRLVRVHAAVIEPQSRSTSQKAAHSSIFFRSCLSDGVAATPFTFGSGSAMFAACCRGSPIDYLRTAAMQQKGLLIVDLVCIMQSLLKFWNASAGLTIGAFPAVAASQFIGGDPLTTKLYAVRNAIYTLFTYFETDRYTLIAGCSSSMLTHLSCR